MAMPDATAPQAANGRGDPGIVTDVSPPSDGWDVKDVAEKLTAMAEEIQEDHTRLAIWLVDEASKKLPVQRFVDDRNWFDDLTPERGEKDDSIRVRFRGGRGRQQEQHVVTVKVVKHRSTKAAVPKYRYHHVQLPANILAPNTMLKFIPHLRDFTDEEERSIYDAWLSELEQMDSQSGFVVLSTTDRVSRLMRDETAAVLRLYLDRWIRKLGMPPETTAELVQAYFQQEEKEKNEITDGLKPYKKKGPVPRNGEPEPDLPELESPAAKVLREAFNLVFDSPTREERRVWLKDVLLKDVERYGAQKSILPTLDRSDILEDGPAQLGLTMDTSVDPFVSTYDFMGCNICFAHSCEHGEFGMNSDKQQFSLETGINLEKQIQRRLASRPADQESRALVKPCANDCYMCPTRTPRKKPKPWTKNQARVLLCLFKALSVGTIPPSCAAAIILDRSCYEIHQEFTNLGWELPKIVERVKDDQSTKALNYYDRYRKVLMGNWKEKVRNGDWDYTRLGPREPCYHDGPCNASNCSCVQRDVLCDRYCPCTVEECLYKFTGCACHAQGKLCTDKQKDKPCICVQLKRECDPALCVSCGALERADPRNADDDELFTRGCQNTVIQRGRPRAVVAGKSALPGYGLYAAEDIPAGAFVLEYTGELISCDEGVRRETRRGDNFNVNGEKSPSYVFTLLDGAGYWVDAAAYGNLSRYINHDAGAKNVEPSILHVCGEYRIKFTALRSIKAGEEIFFDYGEHFPNLTKKLRDRGDRPVRGRNVDGRQRGRVGRPRGSGRGRGRGGRRPGAGRKPRSALSEGDDYSRDDDQPDGASESDFDPDEDYAINYYQENDDDDDDDYTDSATRGHLRTRRTSSRAMQLGPRQTHGSDRASFASMAASLKGGSSRQGQTAGSAFMELPLRRSSRGRGGHRSTAGQRPRLDQATQSAGELSDPGRSSSSWGARKRRRSMIARDEDELSREKMADSQNDDVAQPPRKRRTRGGRKSGSERTAAARAALAARRRANGTVTDVETAFTDYYDDEDDDDVRPPVPRRAVAASGPDSAPGSASRARRRRAAAIVTSDEDEGDEEGDADDDVGPIAMRRSRGQPATPTRPTTRVQSNPTATPRAPAASAATASTGYAHQHARFASVDSSSELTPSSAVAGPGARRAGAGTRAAAAGPQISE